MTKEQLKQHICRYCLCNQHTAQRLEEHLKLCSKHEATKIVMPEEGSVMKFKSQRHTLRQPVVIYADFESIQQPTNVVHGKTILKSKHVPVEFSMVVVSDLPNFQWKPVHYQGPDAEKIFFEKLNKLREAFWKKFSVSKKMVFGKEEVKLHEEQTHCYLCHELFSSDHKKGHKVRDHCHFTGKYR